MLSYVLRHPDVRPCIKNVSVHRFGLGDVPRFFVDLWWIKSLRFLSTIEHTRNKVCHTEKDAFQHLPTTFWTHWPYIDLSWVVPASTVGPNDPGCSTNRCTSRTTKESRTSKEYGQGVDPIEEGVGGDKFRAVIQQIKRNPNSFWREKTDLLFEKWCGSIQFGSWKNVKFSFDQ